MRDVLDELYRRWSAGERVGLGTVVATFRSAPREPGSAMLVAEDGEVSGSVSGGCVEGAVYELAQEKIAEGGSVLQRYGVSDDDAFAVGLTCGGILDVYVEAVDRESFPELPDIVQAVHDGRPVAVAKVVEHSDPEWLGRYLVVWPDKVVGRLGSERADDAVADDARGLLANGRSATLQYGPDGQRRGEGM
ncbi:MAG TPA: XdhC family protein, partial [Pseudonocardiaceae bacterium]|nr:XdhC family protein [Pseudonocardiaceae bacterium]